MTGPEDVKQLLVGTDCGIEVDPNDLSVIGVAGADEFVGGIVEVALRVADLGLYHALDSLVREFHAPEAAGGELGQLQVWLHRGVQIWGLGRICGVIGG